MGSARAAELSDETLMDRYARGDSAAFEELFARYQGRAYGFFAQRTGSEDRASDLYQELFLRIHRARESDDPERPFAPWFFQIARRLLIDALRRSGRSREDCILDEAVSTAPSECGPEWQVAASEQAAALLGQLSGVERYVLVSAKVHGRELRRARERAREVGRGDQETRRLPRLLPQRGRRGCGLLRGGGRHRDADPARPGGTLTEGRPKLVSVVPAEGQGEEELLRLAASLERGSEHPLATAIVRGAGERGVSLADAADFGSVTGKGVTGKVDGRAVALGNRALLEELGIDPGPLAERAEALRGDGQTVMFVAVDGRATGLVGVADPIKESTPKAIRTLHAEGIRIVMLTGDSRTTAKAVAGKLDIDEVIAEVLPDQEVEVVKRLQGEGRIVAMAGDGINDAPALAQAQVGVAMGTGTDVAMESAGVTLVKGDLRAIARARRLSRRTMASIKQNLFFAFAYNAAGVPVAAGVLYPSLGLLLSPIIAAAAMSASSVSVVGNALRLRRAEI